MTYPQLNTLDEAGFKAYFLSHDAFVAKYQVPLPWGLFAFFFFLLFGLG